MKIICISDTHGDHESLKVPDGDVLVHAGDVTAHGSRSDYVAFVEWLSWQSHQHKLFIAGNHDLYLEKYPDEAATIAKEHGLVYLNDSGVEIDRVCFWGSPITPRFHDWAFMREEDEIDEHWKLIPENTDVLITHGPIWGVMDEVVRSPEFTEHTGCPSLAKRVKEIQPAFHIFGHIHEGFGKQEQDGTTFLNVSSMNMHYQMQNTPVSFDINK